MTKCSLQLDKINPVLLGFHNNAFFLFWHIRNFLSVNLVYVGCLRLYTHFCIVLFIPKFHSIPDVLALRRTVMEWTMAVRLVKNGEQSYVGGETAMISELIR